MKSLPVNVWSQSGVDTGFLPNQSQNWWFDLSFPHSFEMFDLDTFYEDNYFKTDHVSQAIARIYVDSVLRLGELFHKCPITSVLEAGCGGGWFTKEFLDRGIDVTAVEGTLAGLAQTTRKGVPADRLLRHDLRLPLKLGRRYQLAVCTEVAEHIECPFAGQLVKSLVDHADVIWFSFEPPGTNDAHYHHCNEQPPKFWLNLFKFHGYNAIEIPDALVQKLAGRGKYIFFNARMEAPGGFICVDPNTPTASLGKTYSQHKARELFRKITPPIIKDVLSIFKRRHG
jgi:SAM-dependent methyltransferase